MSDFNRGTNFKKRFSIEHKFLCWKAKPAYLPDAASAFFSNETLLALQWRVLSSHAPPIVSFLASNISLGPNVTCQQHRRPASGDLPFNKGTDVPWRIRLWDLFLHWNLTFTNKNINWNDRFGSWKWQCKIFFSKIEKLPNRHSSHPSCVLPTTTILLLY